MGFIVGVVGLFGGGGLGGIFGGGLFGKIFGSIISFAFQSVMGGGKKPGIPALADRGLTQAVRQAITERDIVYGRVKKSGPVVFMEATDNNDYMHMIIALASHQCESVDALYIEENEVAWDRETGEITDETYKDHAWAWVKLGTDDQTAMQELVDVEDTSWTSEHRLRGITYIYVKLKWNQDIYSQLPNISVLMKGKNDVYDPRTSSTGYTNNAALCLLDYLRHTEYGLNIQDDEFDGTAWGVEADICDELVPLAAGGSEKRYMVDGVLSTEFKLADNISELMSACGGKLTYRGGKYYLLTAVYRSPTVTLSDQDIISDIEIPVLLSRNELFNGVKGIYISEENDWQPSDFPPVKSEAFKLQDNDERIWQDIDLPYTKSPAACQRIAKQLLLGVRQQIIINFTASLKAFQLTVGDTVNITDTDMGWEDKPFEVISWDLLNDIKTGISVQLSLRETAPSVYQWSTSEETIVDTAPNTNLPSVRSVSPPQDVSLDSGTDALLIDGASILSRIAVSWTQSANAFVRSGGQVEIEFKKSSDEVWGRSNAGYIPGSSIESFVHPVEDGVDYDVRVRFRNAVGARSTWTTLTNHAVVGKSEPPSDVLNFRADQNGAFVTLEWDEVLDLDLDSYQVRLGTQNDTSWEDARILANRVKTNTWTTSVLATGSHTLLIKAKDTTGNFSNKVAARTVTVNQGQYTSDTTLNLAQNGWTGTLENMVIDGGANALVVDSFTAATSSSISNADTEYYPTGSFTWPEMDLGSDQNARLSADLNLKKMVDTTTPIEPELYLKVRSGSDPSASFTLDDTTIISNGGTFQNMVLHHTGKLMVESQDLASVDGTLDEYVQNAYTNCSYTSPEYDLGSDTKVDLSIITDESLGPEETAGTANVVVSIDYRTSAGSYTGFSTFNGGEFEARYFKIRLATTPSSGKTVINSATLDIDNFKRFTGVGEFENIRYAQLKLVVDTSKGVSYLKDYNITLDSI